MNRHYLLLYCLGVYLMFTITEVLLVNHAEDHEDTKMELKRLRDRYKIDDPEDLIEDKIIDTGFPFSSLEPKIPESVPVDTETYTPPSGRVPDRNPREATTTTPPTAKPQETDTLSCDSFDKNNCIIKGVSNFNAHYQIKTSNSILSCLTDSEKIFDACLFDQEIKRKSFLKMPVVPVLKLENKRVLEIGSKFFFVDSSNDPILTDSKTGMSAPTISRLSVRFSGDCVIDQVSMSSPYMIKIKTTENIGFSVKNIKDPQYSTFQTVSGDRSVYLKTDELDGNHFFLCGDKSSFIKKVDVPVRNCVSKYSDEPRKIFFCANFSYFKWIFVFLVITFPITWVLWKTKKAMSIWYDIVGILTYPILILINYFWLYFPFKCRVCGSLSIFSHTCSKLCVCNQSDSSKEHAKECYLFNKNTKEWKSLSLIDHFQFTVNTKVSSEFLIFITKMLFAALLISYIPSSLALSMEKNMCVEKCYYSKDLERLTTDKDGSGKNAMDTCECAIGELITETVYRGGTPISRATTKNDCILSASSCLTSLNQAKNLFACRNGCNALSTLEKIPKVKYSKGYKGLEYPGNLTTLKIANRLRQGFVDSQSEVRNLETKITKDLEYFKSLKVDDIPPENVMSRQSLVFSTEVDGKYRYMIEMDIKKDTGSIYLLNDDSSHVPIEFMIYVKSVGVEYDVRYKYSTAKVDTTVTDYLSVCTGTCKDCRKSKTPVGHNDFCIQPTSWWGCEELGCLAINEGAICGHCTNIFDLSTIVNVYQVVQSHITAEICIKSLDGYNCKKHTDRVPIQTDHYQLDMSVDLHNDFMSTDKLFAVTKQQKILTGSISDLGDFSSGAFGHPQITIDGSPLSVPATLSRDQFSWSCTAVGSKSVNVKQCGLFSYNMIYALTQSKDFSIMDEENNKLYMTKDFLVGKLKVIVDMPKEMFKKTPSKPTLSETKVSCSGCSKCAMGLECDLEYTSDTTFSARMMMDSCSFKSDQIGSFIGPNKKKIKAYCSDSIKEKTIKLVPEDQEDLTTELRIDQVEIIDQDTIISYDDKSAHDENIHHSDTGISTLWDWIKAPFNWVASFFGNFFDIVRIILVVLAVSLGIYIVSYIYNLSFSYYKEKRKRKMEDDLEEVSLSLLSKTKKNGETRRRSPPKTYDFPIDF
ncbi:envelope glycoprotein [Alstroemeria yellow spot virus]|uniref:Envelopment polyprotein n=1 Tax=Alstroemeria yellow spot virus TaxID=2212644 RepID=A0A344AIH1_9VIRU|nr:envelope glycoprotein [Alstroemeria yellow spot virus]AWV56662.1 envelope glycoprotein [Alstroemeria yellow spot virus]